MVGKVDENFLSKMVEETYQLISDEGKVLYFNSTFGELLHDLKVSYFPCKFVDSISCFRTKIGETCIDFPSNWSIFSTIKKKVDSNEEIVFRINKNGDEEKLLDVMKQFVNYPSELLFIFSNRQLFVAYLPEGEEEIFSKISSAFNQSKINVAA